MLLKFVYYCVTNEQHNQHELQFFSASFSDWKSFAGENNLLASFLPIPISIPVSIYFQNHPPIQCFSCRLKYLKLDLQKAE